MLKSVKNCIITFLHEGCETQITQNIINIFSLGDTLGLLAFAEQTLRTLPMRFFLKTKKKNFFFQYENFLKNVKIG